ncbi:MAG: glycosyltransferase, partial [Promethearchaeota archaeon]
TKGFEQEEYAQAIIELLENDEERKKLGQAGRRRVEESFYAERVVKMYEKVFEDVVSE